MAYNYTQHLGLSLWAADDPVLRNEFNLDHKRIDTAIQTLHYAHGCTAGTYEGGASPDRVTIDVGFRPTLAIIACDHYGSSYTSDVMCAVAIGGCYVRFKRSGIDAVESIDMFTDSGIDFAERSSDKYGLNVPGLTYHYALYH